MVINDIHRQNMVFWWDMDADPFAATRPVEIIGTLDNINKAEKLLPGFDASFCRLMQGVLLPL